MKNKKLPIILSLIALIFFGFESYSVKVEKMDNNKVKIAMAQIMCLDGDRSGNLVRVENALIEAKEQQVEIIVFPESVILGWENPEAHDRANPIPGDDSDQLCCLAKKYQMFICIGLDEKDGDKLYDSAILIDDQGNILLKHRKIIVLPELMNPPYSVGNTVSAVKTRFGKIGVLICADTTQPNLLDSMKTQNPDLMLIPYGWAAEEKAWPQHGESLVKVVKNVSNTLNCPAIGTNLIGQISHGPWAGQTYGGLSVAIDNKKDAIVIGKDRERDLVIVNIELAKK